MTEIIRRLGLRDPVVVIGDFDRPRIHLSAQHVRTIPDKEHELVRAAGEFAGPGIVYAATHAGAQAGWGSDADSIGYISRDPSLRCKGERSCRTARGRSSSP